MPPLQNIGFLSVCGEVCSLRVKTMGNDDIRSSLIDDYPVAEDENIKIVQDVVLFSKHFYSPYRRNTKTNGLKHRYVR